MPFITTSMSAHAIVLEEKRLRMEAVIWTSMAGALSPIPGERLQGNAVRNLIVADYLEVIKRATISQFHRKKVVSYGESDYANSVKVFISYKRD
jgi:hypothetical protein